MLHSYMFPLFVHVDVGEGNLLSCSFFPALGLLHNPRLIPETALPTNISCGGGFLHMETKSSLRTFRMWVCSPFPKTSELRNQARASPHWNLPIKHALMQAQIHLACTTSFHPMHIGTIRNLGRDDTDSSHEKREKQWSTPSGETAQSGCA